MRVPNTEPNTVADPRDHQRAEVGHTKGPWKVFGGAYKFIIATGFKGAGGVVICEAPDSEPETAAERANANLIAAAPDYHEAMTECLKPDHGYNITYTSIPLKVWQKFLAAHAKAEGR